MDGNKSKMESVNNLQEVRASDHTKKTFLYDAIRLWNRCPIEIKQSVSLNTAKKEIKNL